MRIDFATKWGSKASIGYARDDFDYVPDPRAVIAAFYVDWYHYKTEDERQALFDAIEVIDDEPQ